MSLTDELAAWYISRRLLQPPNSNHGCGDPLPKPALFDEAFRWNGADGITLACWVIHPGRFRIEVDSSGVSTVHGGGSEEAGSPELMEEYEAPGLADGSHPLLRIFRSGADPLNRDRTVLVLHGWRDSVLKRPYLRGLAALLADSGYRVVMPDLRAHGCSGGDHLTYGILDREDLTLLLDELGRRGWLGGGKAGVFGHSQGGNIALMAAEVESRFGAVVAASAPQSLRWILPVTVRRKHPRLGKYTRERVYDRTLIKAGRRAGLDFRESSAVRAISEMATPVLLIHGVLDETVPFSSSQTIFEARPERTDTLYFQDEAHATYLATRLEVVHDHCRTFLEKNL